MSMSQTLMKPLITGAIAAAGSYFFFDGGNSIYVLGTTLPGYVWIGIAAAGSDYVGEIGANYILPKLSGDWASMEAALLQPVLCGGALVGFNMIAGVSAPGSAMPTFLLGAGSEMASNYVFKNFVRM